MKKILSLIIACAMVLALVPALTMADPVAVATWTIGADAALSTSGSALTGLARTDGGTTQASSSGATNVGGSGWAIGEGFTFSFDASGFENLTLAAKTRASNTGPVNWKVDFSIDEGDTWTAMGTFAAANVSAGVEQNFTFPAAVEGEGEVIVRIVVVDAAGVNGSPFAAGGTFYLVDAVVVSGDETGGGTGPTPLSCGCDCEACVLNEGCDDGDGGLLCETGCECDCCDDGSTGPCTHPGDPIVVPAVIGDCVTKAVSAGTKCGECEAILSGVVEGAVDATNHKGPSVDVAAVVGTCTVKAVSAGKKCDACKVATEGVVEGALDPANHKKADDTAWGTTLVGDVDATETEAGYTGDLICDGCQAIIEEGEVIPPTGGAVEPTFDYTIIAPEIFSKGNMVEKGGKSYLVYPITISGLNPNEYSLSSIEFILKFDNTKLRVNQEMNADEELVFMLYPNFTSANNGRFELNVNTVPGEPGSNQILVAAAFSSRAVPQPVGSDVVLNVWFEILGNPADGTVIPVTFTKAGLTVVTYPALGEVGTQTYTVGSKNGWVEIGAPATPELDYSELEALHALGLIKTPISVSTLEGKDVKPGEYWAKTQADINAFNAEMAKAKKMLDDKDAEDQKEIDDLLKDLQAAYDKIFGPVVVDKSDLQEKYDDALEFKADEQDQKFSDASKGLQDKWIAAIAAAKKVLDDQNATQAQVDKALADLSALLKTGESTVIFAFAGTLVLALAGLAYTVVRKRKFD